MNMTPANAKETPSPGVLDEIWVWEAFRTLRLEGVGIYPKLVEYFHESGFLDRRGDTLEIGGGDGHLWQAGGDALLNAVLSPGQLHVTDTDPALIAKCQKIDRLHKSGIVIERADVGRLLYDNRRFTRILVTHVLHWCRSPEALRHAVHEIARVLDSDGHALIVTVDENVHMVEVYALMQKAKARLTGLGVVVEAEIPSRSPRVLPFCAGNAMKFLQGCFASVQRVDCNYAHLVERVHPSLDIPAHEFMVQYLKTLPFVKEALNQQRLPDAFFEEVSALLEEELATREVFRMSRRDVIYDCSRPL